MPQETRRKTYLMKIQTHQNANEAFHDSDLNTTSTQFPEGTQITIDSPTVEIPGRLPEYNAVESPLSFCWGLSKDGSKIFIEKARMDNAYNEISQWRKNTFLVSYGKTRKEFITN